MRNKLYQQLTPSQEKAVFHHDGPLLILAGPGSGKTRVITCRVAALVESGISPHNICAITFTNKAADEMRQRIFDLGNTRGAHISTFHSLCVRILWRYAEQAGIRPNFTIYDAADQKKCMRQSVKDCQFETSNFAPSRMLAAVSTLKNKLIDVQLFENQADDFFSKVLAKVYKRYQQILTESNALDFDDLLLKTAQLLEQDNTVCTELGNRFKYLLVDEYQDTNHTQYVIARQLAMVHNNICVTGDPDQSIYRWRGADIRNILDFENDWPDTVVVKLEENFRSTPNILALADNLIAANENRKAKKLIATRPAGSDVSIRVFADEIDEAQGVVDRIKKLNAAGAHLREIAVCYRVNSMSRVLEEALIENQIPYQIVRGIEFYGRKEIKDLLAYLKVLVNPDDEAALLRIINTPARGIGKTTTTRIKAYAVSKNINFYQALKNVQLIDTLSKAPKAKAAKFINLLESLMKDLNKPVAELSRRVFAESGLEEFLKITGSADKTELENVKELINAVAKYDRQTEQPSLLDYLQQISLFSDADIYDASAGRVALMTLHAAKGLEFDNIFIVGVEEGLLPHERGEDEPEEIEEERRLFFVGITRARTDLHISCAQYRTIRGQLLRTIPSRFLFELACDFSTEQTASEVRSNLNNEAESEIDNSKPVPKFYNNQLVRHKKFGLGKVKNFNDLGQNSTVVVKFNSGQTKTLVLKYANLSPVKNN